MIQLVCGSSACINIPLITIINGGLRGKNLMYEENLQPKPGNSSPHESHLISNIQDISQINS